MSLLSSKSYSHMLPRRWSQETRTDTFGLPPVASCDNMMSCLGAWLRQFDAATQDAPCRATDLPIAAVAEL